MGSQNHADGLLRIIQVGFVVRREKQQDSGIEALLKQRLLVAGGGFQADGAVAFRREDAALARAGQVHGVAATNLPSRL